MTVYLARTYAVSPDRLYEHKEWCTCAKLDINAFTAKTTNCMEKYRRALVVYRRC
jgi:hypothetical protein